MITVLWAKAGCIPFWNTPSTARNTARKKQFRGIKTKSLSGLPIRTQATAYEDAKGWLHVQTGPIARLDTLAEQLWPLGSQMTVHYNPGNPGKSYVERPIVGNFATLMFNIAGFLLIAMSILLYVLIQR